MEKELRQRAMSILERFEIITSSPSQTKDLGERLSLLLTKGDIVSLIGELGSGKTTFIQGIAKGLSIKEPVNSPSFSLLNIYKGTIPLYHFDLYRIAENEDIGFDDFLFSNGISVIEWGEKASNFLPFQYLKISISHIVEEQKSRRAEERKKDTNKRRILFLPKGKHFIELVKNIRG
ncbi:MAG: tRNA (adenosine(37)-N6)-threonylcarbamoyltransferase complex ATPase subunit type 1 TsaE [bacterium]